LNVAWVCGKYWGLSKSEIVLVYGLNSGAMVVAIEPYVSEIQYWLCYKLHCESSDNFSK
jgi:hypothetical protein